MQEIIIITVLWSLFISLMVWINYTQIKDNDIIDHGINAFITAVCGIILTFCPLINIDLFDRFILLVYLMFDYWILFDIGLNLSRGLNWQYLSTGAKLDRFLTKYSHGEPFFYKVFLLGCFTMIALLIKYGMEIIRGLKMIWN